MLANALTVIASIMDSIGGFLAPTAEGDLTAAMVGAIASLFAVPIVCKIGRKAYGLIRRI